MIVFAADKTATLEECDYFKDLTLMARGTDILQCSISDA